MVHTMLSPMLRTESLDHTDISGVSSAIAASNPSGNLHGEACTDSAISNSMNNEMTSSKPVKSLKLPLQLVDESNACIDLSAGEEKAITLPSASSSSILVYTDWSQKLLDKYHTHYLENLPEVFKYGPVTKKARTEPLSLYTCLEAFLREEPLVPEDMW